MSVSFVSQVGVQKTWFWRTSSSHTDVDTFVKYSAIFGLCFIIGYILQVWFMLLDIGIKMFVSVYSQ